jgi:hypothetical protein
MVTLRLRLSISTRPAGKLAQSKPNKGRCHECLIWHSDQTVEILAFACRGHVWQNNEDLVTNNEKWFVAVCRVLLIIVTALSKVGIGTKHSVH